MTRGAARQIASLAAFTVIAIGVAVAFSLSLQKQTTPGSPRVTSPTPAEARNPDPPRLTRDQINEQQRVQPAQRRSESRAFDQRPLLSQLPMTRAGIRIDIGGLAADGQRTLLTVSVGRRPPSVARRVYREALLETRDPGTAYVVELVR